MEFDLKSEDFSHKYLPGIYLYICFVDIKELYMKKATANLNKDEPANSPSHLYRFRKIHHILKYKELENDEIYFSCPEELNDPAENLTNLFWQGDKIVWEGLFKHYIITLEQWETFEMIAGNSSNIILNTAQLSHSVDQLPTEAYKTKILNIYSKFFDHPSITELIHFLGSRKRKIRRQELQFYLTITLRFISDLISISNQKYTQSNHPITNYNNEVLKKVLTPSFFSSFKKEEKKLGSEESIDATFDISSSFLDLTQMTLCVALKNYHITQKNKRKISSLMIIDNYLTVLESLTFPYRCIASFTQHCNNTAVWGHYSDGHKGICLKFKTQKFKDGGIGLSLKNKSYFNTESVSVIPFQKILYQRQYPEIDFFKSMGILPQHILEKHWFSDKEGNQTSSINFMKNEESWRNNYWKNFNQRTSIKLKEWEYEHEYRLVIPSFFSDIKNKRNRIFKYNFSSLEGIVFGIKTSNEEKFEIMKIIIDKCKKESRTDFKFYQAYYNAKKGLIENKEMGIANLSIADIKKKNC